MTHGWASQNDYDVRFEWGASGVTALVHDVAVVVIVDVLRFTTAVDAAVSRGAVVYPYRSRDDAARSFAASIGAVLADGDSATAPSLSPLSLLHLRDGERVVLPSPNGSTCASLAAESGATVVAACLRNAGAVADWLRGRSRPVLIVAAGERWPDDSLRPAVEDLVGAGAVIDALGERASPEGAAAARAWRGVAADTPAFLSSCSSGRALISTGRLEDVGYASQVNVSRAVPVLVDGAFRVAHQAARSSQPVT